MLAFAAALAGGACGAAASSADGQAAADVRSLARALEERHPDPYHDVPRETFRAEIDQLAGRADELDRDRLLVELMRVTALLGERDGHSGVFPLDGHERALHVYPLRLYRFADGTFVVGSIGARGIVGARLVAIDDRPLAEVEAAVRPLVPRDNEHSRVARTALYLVTAEVLHGLGITGSPTGATFTFESRGVRRDVRLAPVTATRYTAAFRDLWHPMVPAGLPARATPTWLRRRHEGLWLGAIDGGRVLYLAYNATLEDTGPIAATLLRRARRPNVRRVVVDLRHNPGGNVNTSEALLGALTTRAIDRPGRLVVLIGRTTFSAAAIFATHLDAKTSATFVGEPTGGSPNLFGDPTAVDLPSLGWRVNIGTYLWRPVGDDARTAIEPDVHVELTSRDFFGGRDPVLAKAVSLREP